MCGIIEGGEVQSNLDAYYNAQAAVYRSWGPALARRLQSSADRAAYEEDMRQLDSAIAKHLGGSRFVVDVGCGPSRLRTTSHDQSLVLVDRSPAMLHEARSFHGSCSRVYTQACGTMLPLANGVADLAICTFLLSHLDDLAFPQVLREITRVLRPGGVAVIADSACSIVPTAAADIQTRIAADGRSYRVPKYYRCPSDVGAAFHGGALQLAGTARFVFTLEWSNV